MRNTCVLMSVNVDFFRFRIFDYFFWMLPEEHNLVAQCSTTAMALHPQAQQAYSYAYICIYMYIYTHAVQTTLVAGLRLLDWTLR